MKNGGGGPRI